MENQQHQELVIQKLRQVNRRISTEAETLRKSIQSLPKRPKSLVRNLAREQEDPIAFNERMIENAEKILEQLTEEREILQGKVAKAEARNKAKKIEGRVQDLRNIQRQHEQKNKTIKLQIQKNKEVSQKINRGIQDFQVALPQMEELKQQWAAVEKVLSDNKVLFQKGQQKIDDLKKQKEDLKDVPDPVFTPPPKPITPGDPKVLKSLGAQLAKVLAQTEKLPLKFEQEVKEMQQVTRQNNRLAKQLKGYLGSYLAQQGDVLQDIMFKPKAAIN